MNGLLYCFKEGFSKVFSKKGAVMTVASICIAAAVLTLSGCFPHSESTQPHSHSGSAATPK